MFFKKCKIKQDILTDKIMFQLLNIEIRDLHTRIFHRKKDIQKIIIILENTVEKRIISLFMDYYTTKLKFIISTELNQKQKLTLRNAFPLSFLYSI